MTNILSASTSDAVTVHAAKNPSKDKTGILFIEIDGVASVDVYLRHESGGTNFLVKADITATEALPIALAPYIALDVDYTSGTGVTVDIQE